MKFPVLNPPDPLRESREGSSPSAWSLSWTEGIAIAIFWVGIGILINAQHFSDPGRSDTDPGKIVFLNFFIVFVWGLLTPPIFWLNHRFSPELGDWRRYAVLHLVNGFLLSVVTELGINAVWNYVIYGNEDKFRSVFEVIQGFHFLPAFFIYLIVLGAGFARDYAIRYRQRVMESAQLRMQAAELQSQYRAQEAELKSRIRAQAAEHQAQLAEARLQALRMQVNPHFLFNTLNAISTLVDEDPGGVRRMICRLSDLLRYTLTQTSSTEVPLHQEVAFLNGYLEIQQIRFQDKLNVSIRINDELREAMVPNLILQPLVENAIKHGLDPTTGRGQIEIMAVREDEELRLTVRDYGPGMKFSTGDGAPAVPQTGVGIRNTRERLENLYGSMQRLILEDATEGGLRVMVVLPFHTSADFRTSSV